MPLCVLWSILILLSKTRESRYPKGCFPWQNTIFGPKSFFPSLGPNLNRLPLAQKLEILLEYSRCHFACMNQVSAPCVKKWRRGGAAKTDTNCVNIDTKFVWANMSHSKNPYPVPLGALWSKTNIPDQKPRIWIS